jgi:hypothetical protein
MIRKFRFRPLLLTAAVLVGSTLTSPARAGAAGPGFHSGPRPAIARTADGEGFLSLAWRWLHTVWGASGSSMDPLGNH